MKTWFIWNNQSSDNMGVILESIPPIIKPKKRYTTTTIDNVDGSQIEELGYDAYVKQLSLGFRYEDVDKVKAWLNGSSKLIFSSELDVYYKAIVLDEIQYKKDIIFCHATVSFLVQPYKYATYERSVKGDNVSIYNNGNVESLPRITINGTGEIIVTVNNDYVCTLKLNGNDTIILDSEKQDCYRKDGTLANRNMQGDFPKLAVGKNTLVLFGNVTKVETEVRQRWL